MMTGETGSWCKRWRELHHRNSVLATLSCRQFAPIHLVTSSTHGCNLLTETGSLVWTTETIHLCVVSIKVRKQLMLLNKVDDACRVKQKEDWPKYRALRYTKSQQSWSRSSRPRTNVVRTPNDHWGMTYTSGSTPDVHRSKRRKAKQRELHEPCWNSYIFCIYVTKSIHLGLHIR